MTIKEGFKFQIQGIWKPNTRQILPHCHLYSDINVNYHIKLLMGGASSA